MYVCLKLTFFSPIPPEGRNSIRLNVRSIGISESATKLNKNMALCAILFSEIHLARVGGDELARPPPLLVVHGTTGVAPVAASVVLAPACVLLQRHQRPPGKGRLVTDFM